KYQDQGLGGEALATLIKYIKTMPLGNGNKLYLSYVPSNVAAQQLYKAAGFVPNGERIEEEVVLVLDLEK
ncbi:GNAT family N-acetyltransferase, partial [Lactobacillus taiwanensis]